MTLDRQKIEIKVDYNFKNSRLKRERLHINADVKCMY